MSDIEKSFSNLAKGVGRTIRMTHAAVVACAAAILDHDLERSIKTLMRPLNSKLDKSLFTGYGPLSTFSSKIDMAYALGIISSDVHREMNKIREIRNKFAHSKALLSLDQAPIVDTFNNLHKPAGARGAVTEVFMLCVSELNDVLEKYLLSKGITDDLSDKNTPPELRS